MLSSPLPFRRGSGDSAHAPQVIAQALALLLAFACAALAVTWGLRLTGTPRPVPLDARLVGSPSPDRAARQAARLFGAEPVKQTAAAAPGRFRLFGVIAGGDSGSALIGIDGHPPRAVAVGQPVAPGVVLRSTAYKAVWIESDGTRRKLELEPPTASVGTTPPAYVQPGPTFVPPPTISPPAIGPRIDNEPR